MHVVTMMVVNYLSSMTQVMKTSTTMYMKLKKTLGKGGESKSY